MLAGGAYRRVPFLAMGPDWLGRVEDSLFGLIGPRNMRRGEQHHTRLRNIWPWWRHPDLPFHGRPRLRAAQLRRGPVHEAERVRTARVRIVVLVVELWLVLGGARSWRQGLLALSAPRRNT